MKKLFGLLLLAAAPAFAQSNGWDEVATGWGEIQLFPQNLASGDVTSVAVTASSPLTGSATCSSGACAFTLGIASIYPGAQKDTVSAKSGDGAIASAPGTIFITKSSALGSSTLATPTATTHDGYLLRIVSTTAFAHVISVASGKVNGGTNTTITFTSGASGDSVTLEAYQGVWYVIGSRGTITVN